MDLEMIHHFSHEHPLCRIQEVAEWSGYCYGCCKYLSLGEAIYGCKHDDCSSIGCYLHEECAEMPRHIRHAVHPSHQLTQSAEYIHAYNIGLSAFPCAVCDGRNSGLIYICSEDCSMIWIHLGCAGGSDATDESAAETKHHPSHPRHELRLQRRRKASTSCSFHCDACGTIEEGNLYSCSICNYWIHESCADLPETNDFPLHHPNHPLSLSYYLPYEYSKYKFTCAICDGPLRFRPWVYHCRLCRFVVHVKCATNTKIDNENNADDDGKGIMKFPINDIYEEMIKRFTKKNMISCSGKHKFHNHHHPVKFATFGLSASSHDPCDDNDDDQVITCDGCTLPIHKQSSGTTTTTNNCCSYEYDDSGYMYCGECDYFLHLACFNLPPEVSSHPLHPIEDHKLTLLQKSNYKLVKNWSRCDACGYPTNGLFYSCNECSFILDIKCASLPDAMKHAGHPRPHHLLKLVVGSHVPSFCGVCYYQGDSGKNSYRCDSCRFSMCLECVFLPASNKHRLEKHPLPLTYNASVNHPGDFCCGSCEGRMHPRMWMYHCRHCEESFHPLCFPATSGRYRNINFRSRQQYCVNVSSKYHKPHHPLKFQIITNKKYCDLCPRPDQVLPLYDKPGFQCADCNFVSCMEDHPNVSIKPSSSTHNNSQFLLL